MKNQARRSRNDILILKNMSNQNMNQNIIESGYPYLTQIKNNSVEETIKSQMQAKSSKLSWEDIRGLSLIFSHNETLIQED